MDEKPMDETNHSDIDYHHPQVVDQSDFEYGLTEQDKMELRLWLRLLTCSTMIEQRVRDRLREGFEFSLARFDVLAQLDRAPEGLSMGELSSRLMVSGGNATGLTSRMLAEGMITREPVAHDRRRQVVRLTEHGRRLFKQMYPEHARWIHEAMSGLSGDEQQLLLGLLGKLKKQLTDGGPK
ncbi:MAG: MarR family transcriptional regulator [Aquisalimonadaceae bacterium]